MPAQGKEQFANFAIVTVAESAANTLTFKKLETGISLTEKVAWIIARIEYWPDPLTAAQFNATGDTLAYGMTVSNAWATPSPTETAIIDFNAIEREDLGTAASGFFLQRPLVKDFTSLPSGGIIVPPAPLYLYAKGTSLVGAANVTARIYYTLLSLAVDQYWELVEARRILTS
jgi:hypothetical protein